MPALILSLGDDGTTVKIIFLGTGGAFSEGRFWASHLINDSILVDVSPTAVPALKRCGKELAGITHIFITHYHGDHTLGLPFLLAEYTFKSPRKKPLFITGPERIEEYTFRLADTAFPGYGGEILQNAMITFTEVKEEIRRREAGGIPFIAYTMSHFGAQSYGYKIFTDRAVIAFSGDTGPCENLLRLIEGSDAAIVEMSGIAHDNPNHMTMQNILDLKSRLNPEQKLFVTHMDERVIPHLEGIIVPEDLKEYEIAVND